MNKTARKKEILYAAYSNERPEAGLNYAIYLASLLGAELRVILFKQDSLKPLSDTLSMTSSARDTQPVNASSSERTDNDIAFIHQYLNEKCREAGVSVNVHSGFMETAQACFDFIGKRRISMILLSPSVTENGRVLAFLKDSFPQTVVTMGN